MFGIFSPAPYFLEKGEGLKMELMVDQADVMKPLKKPNTIGFGELLGW